MRFPARPALQNGLLGKDSPAQEQAASCNDAGSHAESDCVTPHNQLKVRASSPTHLEGCYLFHKVTLCQNVMALQSSLELQGSKYGSLEIEVHASELTDLCPL